MFSSKMTALALMTVLPVTTSCGRDEKPDLSVVQNRFFSTDYDGARLRFREAAEHGGARLSTLDLDAKGPTGEDLTIDIAWFGAEQPRQVLLHSSGVHGVEAFAGSAIQLQWLAKGISPPEDTAVVLVHVVNPYGMAGLRRFNESNVDLNRNFIPTDAPYQGAPEGFEQLDSFLNPSTPPSWDFYYLRAGWLIARYGMSALKQTIAGGQYENPKGLFFGGKSLQQGPRKLQQFVANRLADVEHLVVIDVHTGLGPFGVDTLLVHAADEGSPLYRTMQKVFGDRVASLDPDRSVAYRISGAYDTMYPRVLPKTDVYFVCQEFGTYNSVEVVGLLRAENRWHHHGKGGIDHASKLELKEAFNPDDESWRKEVLHRGAEVIEQGLNLAFAE